MCGHGSITFAADFKPERGVMEAGASMLLKRLDHRGGDACGIMAWNGSEWLVEKAAVPAKEFNAERRIVPDSVRALAVHTRMATRGAPEWDKNNHPVVSGSVLLMHNGVVQDHALKRVPGDPKVDTFAMSMAVAALKGRGNEKPHSFAERAMHALAELRGSMTTQVAIQGKPFLLSGRIRTNPLYMGYSVCGLVRVTASTYDSVEACFDAMEIDVADAKVEESETRGKGKRAKTVKVERIVPAIYSSRDGFVFSWADGVHDQSSLTLKEPVYQSQSWQGNGSHWSNKPTPAQGKAVVTTTATPKWAVGDVVKIIATGRIGVIADVKRQSMITYGLNVTPERRVISGKETTLGGYYGILPEGSLSFVALGKASDLPNTTKGLPAYIEAILAVVKQNPDAQIGKGKPGDNSKSDLASCGVVVSKDDTWNDLVDRLTGSEGAFVECDICGDWDDACRLQDECLVCPECFNQMTAWEKANPDA